MFNSFPVPTPFGNYMATPDPLGGARLSNGQGYITAPNPFGERTIHVNNFGMSGCDGTIRPDVFGNPVVNFHNIWQTNIPPSV
jgi:hypothetical protein